MICAHAPLTGFFQHQNNFTCYAHFEISRKLTNMSMTSEYYRVISVGMSSFMLRTPAKFVGMTNLSMVSNIGV